MLCADCTTKVPTVAHANAPSVRPSVRLCSRHTSEVAEMMQPRPPDAGGQTSFAPGASSAAKQIGKSGLALYDDVVTRVRATIEADFDVPRLYNAGAGRSPLGPPPVVECRSP